MIDYQTLRASVQIQLLVHLYPTSLKFRSSVRHAESFWKQTPSAFDWSSFKSLCNQYHYLIFVSKEHFYSNLVSSSFDNPKRLCHDFAFLISLLFWHHRPQHLNNSLLILVRYPWLCSQLVQVFTTVCSTTRSKVKVKVTSPWKLEILPYSNAIFSAIYNGNWQLTTDY